jgi:GH24 family phage-related lysozyme (muramidase)
MIYSIQVKRQDTGALLSGATVSFTSGDGELLGNLITGADGRVTFDDGVNPNFVFDGTKVLASAPGYSSLSIDGSALQPSWYFALVPDTNSVLLPLLLVGAGVGIGAAYLMRSKRRRVGTTEGSSHTNYAQYILPAGVLVLGYFVVRKFTNALGITETPEEQAQREASQDALLSTTTDVLRTQSPTMSDAALAALADRIYADLRSPVPLFNTNDADDAVAALGTVRNTADLLKLIAFFGTRSQTLFGIPGPAMTLAQFVRTASHGPDQSQIDGLNASYAAAGIQWQW